jgi:phosphoribosylformylglycinamidine synthase
VISLGRTQKEKSVSIVTHIDGNAITLLCENMAKLRDIWESTSFEIDQLQANIDCVTQEKVDLSVRSSPPYCVTFESTQIPCIFFFFF